MVLLLISILSSGLAGIETEIVSFGYISCTVIYNITTLYIICIL